VTETHPDQCTGLGDVSAKKPAAPARKPTIHDRASGCQMMVDRVSHAAEARCRSHRPSHRTVTYWEVRTCELSVAARPLTSVCHDAQRWLPLPRETIGGFRKPTP
jgi:hypothetical protein